MAKRTAATPSTPRKRAASKKPDGSTAAPTAPEPTEHDIRTRAYHRYLERGAGHGGDFDDWLEAEKELKSSRS